MIKTIFSSLLLFLMGTPIMAGDIYVAPTGSDTAPGTVSAPLLTPAAAIRMAREWRRLNRQETAGGIRIHLSGGDYRLQKPLFLRPEDSGTPDSPTVICGDDDGKPTVISGGMPLGGWHKGCSDTRIPENVRSRVWVADAPRSETG